jgi:hypothetical protein
LKRVVPENLAGGMERLVGVALLGLGLWTLYSLARAVRGGGDDAHHCGHHHCGHHHGDHGHHDHHHDHHHGSLWMGMLHGVAGTAAFVGETLVAVSQSYALVLAYTFAFSVGVLVAMAAYAGALGGLLSWGGRRVRWVSCGAQALAGAAACAVGILWIVK